MTARAELHTWHRRTCRAALRLGGVPYCASAASDSRCGGKVCVRTRASVGDCTRAERHARRGSVGKEFRGTRAEQRRLRARQCRMAMSRTRRGVGWWGKARLACCGWPASGVKKGDEGAESGPGEGCGPSLRSAATETAYAAQRRGGSTPIAAARAGDSPIGASRPNHALSISCCFFSAQSTGTVL